MSTINSRSSYYDTAVHAFSSCFSKKSVMITVAVALAALALLRSTSSTTTLQRQATLITGCALGLLGIYLFTRYYFKKRPTDLESTPIETQQIPLEKKESSPKTHEELLRERRQQAIKNRSQQPDFGVKIRRDRTSPNPNIQDVSDNQK